MASSSRARATAPETWPALSFRPGAANVTRESARQGAAAARKLFQIQRNEIQIQRNKIKAGGNKNQIIRNKNQARRNKNQINFPSSNPEFSIT